MPSRRKVGRWRRKKGTQAVNVRGEPVGPVETSIAQNDAIDEISPSLRSDETVADETIEAGKPTKAATGIGLFEKPAQSGRRSTRGTRRHRRGARVVPAQLRLRTDDETPEEGQEPPGDGADGAGNENGDRPGRVPLIFDQTATARQITPLVLRNILFNILTLSLYRFWARTHIRRYLWSKTTINDEALEYTGRGLELFVGFIFVSLFVILPIIAAFAAIEYFATVYDETLLLLYLPLYLLLFLLIGVAVYRARAYRLSRTSWRSIRFAQTGSSLQYGFRYLYFLFGNVLTLTWLTPLQNVTLMRQMISNMWFGDRQFRFNGRAGPLYRVFAMVWILNIFVVIGYFAAIGYLFPELVENITMEPSTPEEVFAFFQAILAFYGFLIFVALTTVWYQAKEMRYFAESTCFESVRFKLRATTLSLLWLGLGNLIIIVLTLGLGLPYTQVRTFRYLFRRLEAEGELDIHGIMQTSLGKPGMGEGLADAFDLGAV